MASPSLPFVLLTQDGASKEVLDREDDLLVLEVRVIAARRLRDVRLALELDLDSRQARESGRGTRRRAP